ncbi:MAG: PIN domain-containing protein [Candidatus Desulfatibia sp.]|uniref:type II toxin-antitoxin system VapC family toxin n=1 Tax=Candidatus Desulfatibia sp. TaxID=3101189 RepID=UPI002F31748A
MESEDMIYLDTHVVLWLYALRGEGLSRRACQLIEESVTVLISPMVLLELVYLYEIDRLKVESDQIYRYLQQKIRLKVCTKPFVDVIQLASKQSWTRDPFDRIITAQAAIDHKTLVTKNITIRQHYSKAIW